MTTTTTTGAANETRITLTDIDGFPVAWIVRFPGERRWATIYKGERLSTLPKKDALDWLGSIERRG